MSDLDKLEKLGIDTSEGEEPSVWEERFETQLNTFFDEAIARVPGFVDRHLKSFRRIMGRSLGPKTGLGDVLVSARNLVSSVSKAAGGPDFSTTTYTNDQLTEAFEREVVSSEELETLLNRLFREFEQDQWAELEEEFKKDDEKRQALTRAEEEASPNAMRDRIVELMETEIGHDPLLAQAIRSGVKIGLPATLGYVLFGKVTFPGGLGSEAASELYKRRLDFYNRALYKLGRFHIPGWVGAIGWAGGLVGTLAIGGLMEYAINSVRDLKGVYIRQLNSARYALLYGENPEEPEGQGILHLVRGLERQFDKLADMSAEELARVEAEANGELPDDQD